MIKATILRCFNALAERTGFTAIEDAVQVADFPDEVTLQIKAVAQLNSFCCGATAGFTVVGTFQPKMMFGDFYEALAPDPERGGVSRSKLVRVLRQFRVCVRLVKGLNFPKIRDAIDDGCPVITTIQEPDADCSHWVVLYGYGQRPRRVFLAVKGLPYFNRNRYDWAHSASPIQLFPAMWLKAVREDGLPLRQVRQEVLAWVEDFSRPRGLPFCSM